MRRSGLVACAAAVAAAAPLAAHAAAPPGATARCVDGTYSFSQHRSGTCSHHHGVAQWLAAPGSGAVAVSVQVRAGRTVRLGARTRTAHCRLGVLPDRRCSPGAFAAGLTTAVICSSGFRTSSVRDVPQALKHAVEREYGLTPRAYGRTLEIDHIVPLELGGSNDIANLYPERADAHPGYHVKDVLENRLHRLVCSGAMQLRAAQRAIARDWRALDRTVAP